MTLRNGQRIHTPDGPGLVIKDCRRLPSPDPASHETVWVLLDAGDNPQPYRPNQIHTTTRSA